MLRTRLPENMNSNYPLFPPESDSFRCRNRRRRASLMGALNFIVTVLDLRTRGMSLMRMPLTVWSWFTTAILGLLAFAVLMGACVLLLLDRVGGTSFFIVWNSGAPGLLGVGASPPPAHRHRTGHGLTHCSAHRPRLSTTGFRLFPASVSS